MVKEVQRAKEGYEKVVEAFDNAIATIEEVQNAEIEQVKAKYADRLNGYINERLNYVVVETVEIPDEEVQVNPEEVVV